jgi:fumarylacetoacetase
VIGTWVEGVVDNPFSIDHLPYGSALGTDDRRRVVVRIGSSMLDLTAATADGPHADLFASGSLDDFLAAGRTAWTAVRALVTDWLTNEVHQDRMLPLLSDVADAQLALPFAVADYVDFYASEHHASNVGRIFRPDGAALSPNWKHLPIGYHGRAGTIVVSGTDVRRPSGQSRSADGVISFRPSARLDIEAEVAFVVGVGSGHGTPVPIADFREHVFGLCLLNDWSARDIQAWESVPLGPFLGKSFATSISAWITPLDALEAAWTPPPPRDPQPLPYLDDAAVDDSRTPAGLDLALEVRLNGQLISRPPFATMYWTPAQLMAHMTVNGASLRSGDVFASGTISGAHPAERGSLLELSWGGTQPFTLPDGTTRTFLEDGDEVIISASAPGRHGRIGLGDVHGRIVAAH